MQAYTAEYQIYTKTFRRFEHEKCEGPAEISPLCFHFYMSCNEQVETKLFTQIKNLDWFPFQERNPTKCLMSQFHFL
jgi:hypothetical protein